MIFKHPARSQAKNELPRHFENPHIPFISEISFKFENMDDLKTIQDGINMVKKNVIKREKRAFERLTLQEQPELIINRSPTVPKLGGLLAKPKGSF
jgi:nucleosome binding factor SPN SPT16 subunit